uniref:Bnr asp-box repeat protein n=1 Tax=Tetraselmis sp. GSL018 TaxID=582737 RepID=A0A061SM53_9CHLO
MRASAGVLVSSDKGAHWNAYGEVTHPLTWLIENSVVELKHDGSLLMLFRTWAGRIFQSRSTDGGRSWSPAAPMQLPNPDAKIHVISLEGSTDLLLAFNDHQKYAEDGFTRFRTGLRVAISHDFGATWARIAEVDETNEPGWQFHYPTLMQHGCNISITYSRTYVASSEDDLIGGNSTNSKEMAMAGIRIMTFDLSQLAARFS